MKIALVADLHGNLPALEAVDADIRRRGADEIWCLGDLAGKGPSSAETFDWAMQNCSVILCGNWDEGIGKRYFATNDQFYYAQLGDTRMRQLLELPYEHHVVLSGRHLRLLHGRPIMSRLLSTFDPERELEWLFAPDFNVVGYGDIHHAGLRALHGNRILFSVGSVGNSIRIPLAQYTLLECEKGEQPAPFDLQYVYLPYDVARAVHDAESAENMPHREAYIQEITTGVYGRAPKAGSST